MGTRSIRKNKHRKKVNTGKYMIAVMLLLLGVFLTGYICRSMLADNETENFEKQKKITKLAHVSIDDATQIFQDIHFHGYDSIFDNEVMQSLWQLHNKYGLKVTLYVFGELDDFGLWDFPKTYQKEFEANADWLKIGYHSMKEENPAESPSTEKEFLTDFEKVNQTICEIAGEKSLAHVLRLHYWYATDWMVQDMEEQGITGLLCSDSDMLSYDLTEHQQKSLYASRDGKIIDDLNYYVTDIRLEKTENIKTALEDKKSDRILVVFTHAWCYMDNEDKMQETAEWMAKHGYRFTFFEE